MSHERLAARIKAHQAALERQPEDWATHEAIIGVLQALDKGEIKEAQALRLLGLQATRLADEPIQVALSRQAAADLRQMQRAEYGR